MIMMDCQLVHYLADIALSVRWVALYGVLLGSFGVIFFTYARNPTEMGAYHFHSGNHYFRVVADFCPIS